MTLKDPWAYLEITGPPEHPAIECAPHHATELEALFFQHDIHYDRESGWAAGQEALELRPEDLDRAREVLEGYKDAKGNCEVFDLSKPAPEKGGKK